MKRKNIIFLLLFIISTIFIFKNSAKPASESTVQSSFFVDWVINNFSMLFKNRDVTTVFIRKLAHFAEFFMQSSFLSLTVFSEKYHKSVIYILFTGLLTACTDEFIQLFFNGRGSMVSDIFIDFSGTCFSVLFFIFAFIILKRGKKL